MDDLTRHEVDAKIAAVEAKVENRLINLETFVKTGFAEQSAQFAELRIQFAELRTQFADLRADMHKNTITIIKWGFATMLAFSALTIGVVTYVVDNALEHAVQLQQPAVQPSSATAAPTAPAAPVALKGSAPAPATAPPRLPAAPSPPR